MRRTSIVCALSLLVACGSRNKETAPGTTPSTTGNPTPGETTTTKVVKDGDKTTVITTTTKVVEAPEPADRPADAWPSDPLVKYNVDQLNAYRKKVGQPALLYDAQVSAFALAGSKQLSSDHTPHTHFNANVKNKPPGFGTRSSENQGDWEGVPSMDKDPLVNGKKQIDVMLKIMWDEGPGEGPAHGHYTNMVNPKYKRIGVGLFYSGGQLYMTNDLTN